MTCPCEVLETPLVVSSERVSGLSRGQGPVSAITPEETSWERTFRETRFPGRGDSYEDPAELADAPTSVAGPANANGTSEAMETVPVSEYLC